MIIEKVTMQLKARGVRGGGGGGSPHHHNKSDDSIKGALAAPPNDDRTSDDSIRGKSLKNSGGSPRMMILKSSGRMMIEK